ncbi:MAG: hypothetical protein R3277_03380 [Brumimicrobium sp.]|nr:hypothetical protein [Brumimicrobium sp.]
MSSRMKRNLFKPLLALYAVLLLGACNIQELENYNDDFSGSWQTKVYYSPAAGDSIRNFLVIDGKNSAFGLACDKDSELSGCLYFQSGKAKINKRTNGLQIGNSVQNVYRIDQEPFINSLGNWQIMIDSIPYFKY